jgi:cysteinyl-tRNA synthetase
LWDAFADAMDDDLGTPAAIGVIHNAVRRGNTLLTDGDVAALSATLNVVVRMLDVLGLDPADPAWGSLGGSDDDTKLAAAVDALVAGLLEERAAARADQDWGRADALRDRIAAAGIDVEDTPDGPKWTVR